jgi:hypothetical protein
MSDLTIVQESGLEQKPRVENKQKDRRPYHRYSKEQQYNVLKHAIDHPDISLATIAKKHGIHCRMIQKWMAKLINPDPTPSRLVLPMESMLWWFRQGHLSSFWTIV